MDFLHFVLKKIFILQTEENIIQKYKNITRADVGLDSIMCVM